MTDTRAPTIEELVDALRPFAEYYDMLERNSYLEGGLLLWAYQAGTCIGSAFGSEVLQKASDLLSRARTGAEGAEPSEAMINTMRGIILKNTWSNEDLVSHCRALLAVAQSAPTLSAGEAVERVARARQLPDLVRRLDLIVSDREAASHEYDEEITATLREAHAAIAAMSSPDERARAEEREACAKIAEAIYFDREWHPYYSAAGSNIAVAIRARGPATEKE